MGYLLRIKAVAAKEFWVLVRQPQLLVMLLLGPVVIMVLFALSFRVENYLPRAVVVVEEGSEGEEIFREFRRQFVERTRFQGVLRSVQEADRMLREGRTDAVIILPPDPSRAVAEGRQAVLEVHYQSINPIAGTTVPNRSNGLVLDLNRAIVREGIATEVQNIGGMVEEIEAINRQLERVSRAAEALTSEGAREITSSLEEALVELEESLEGLEGREAEEALERVRRARELLDELIAAQQAGARSIEERLGITELQRALDRLSEQVARVPSGVPPRVLANPFRLELENLAPFEPTAVEFYAPATLALLIQHIALSLASLAIVRERVLGAYEFFEVSPLRPGGLLAGKFLTYLALVVAVNLVVAGVLAAVLEIPVRGGFTRLAAAMAVLAAASVSAGFLLSVLSRSQLQAIQVSMLVFIASGFFSGFLFPLRELEQPALAVSYFLPATYGIRALQEVMILGRWPALGDLLGLAAIFCVSAAGARLLLARRGGAP
ncbi:hypothetical protein Rxycam_02093 [Rubrobacter xylanophilus DSM 9941]|uniref:ABC transporter permease n=1 Tax=Rubrobacter xylanophilus TaxID=49319 RepID=UPI001C642F5F|nr:ABC transporter permease [Rubrobacter xylanophilus]QYJ16260.1 hypothetical protein Rxycam_02093 [Rubrobacter xylanophilus DSM 9941]